MKIKGISSGVVGGGYELVRCAPVNADSHPSILFAHGVADSARSWTVHWLKYFACKGYQSYAFSFRGHGGSFGRDRLHHLRISDYVEDLIRVRQYLLQESAIPPILIGHSMGALVVQRSLAKLECPAAVLLAPVSPNGCWFSMWQMLWPHPSDFVRVLFGLPLPPARRAAYLFHPSMERDRAESLAGKMGAPLDGDPASSSYLMAESLRANFEMLFPSRIERNSVPTLVIAAQDDRVVSVGGAQRMANLVGAEFCVVPHLAHAMCVDVNWHVPADEIIDWLTKV